MSVPVPDEGNRHNRQWFCLPGNSYFPFDPVKCLQCSWLRCLSQRNMQERPLLAWNLISSFIQCLLVLLFLSVCFFPYWLWCISTACLQYAEEMMPLFLYGSWRLIELLMWPCILPSPGVKAVLLCYMGVMGYPDRTSFGWHLHLCATKREFCIWAKRIQVVCSHLMFFNTDKEESCKLPGF